MVAKKKGGPSSRPITNSHARARSVGTGRALRPDLPDAERAEQLFFRLAYAKVDAAALADRRPDDRRFAVLAFILGEIAQALFFDDDPRSLDGVNAWAARRERQRGSHAALGGRGFTIQQHAAHARDALQRHAQRNGSRIQAAWLLSRHLGVLANAHSRDERRPWIRRLYAAMPLTGDRRHLDREGTEKQSPIDKGAVRSAVIAALRTFGVPESVASKAFAAEDMQRTRATRRRLKR